MRRSLFLAAAAVATATLLAACGDDDSTATTDGDTQTTDTSMMDDEMGHDVETSPVAPGARRIEVTASSFEFDPDEITVAAGEDVAIVLTSDDEILHDFTIDELDAHVAAEAGETAEGGLRADDPGEYDFYCTVEGHRDAGMEGTLIVE